MFFNFKKRSSFPNKLVHARFNQSKELQQARQSYLNAQSISRSLHWKFVTLFLLVSRSLKIKQCDRYVQPKPVNMVLELNQMKQSRRYLTGGREQGRRRGLRERERDFQSR
jgi:hypothetical protein